jgi:hypothetical protein
MEGARFERRKADAMEDLGRRHYMEPYTNARTQNTEQKNSQEVLRYGTK